MLSTNQVQIPLNFKIAVSRILLCCLKEWKKLSLQEELDQHLRFKELQEACNH
jgi:hypothetical protein